ncbi:MAG: outer membrane protein assembly factor BamD [Fidelibacterota bacterium]
MVKGIMKKQIIIIVAIILLITACSSSKPQEDVDLQVLFDKAMISLEKKRYLRAQEEFNNLAIQGLHTDLGDDAQFYLGESYFLNKEYILAIAEYDRLIRRMGFSEFVQKARWRVCQCYVNQSPKYYHEQISTDNALSKLQEFLDDYPDSEYANEAISTISKLRDKLAKKLYETGRLYIKMDEYESAILAYQDLLSKYYDTDFVGDAHVQIIKCYSEMGDLDKANEYYFDNKSKITEDDQLSRVNKLLNGNQ